MKLVKTIKFLSTTAMIGLMATALGSCTNNNSSSQPSNTTASSASSNTGTKPTSSGTGASSSSSSTTPIDDTGIFSTAELENDLVLDDEGKPSFDEPVTLKMWSIIGDPDQVVFAKLVQQFNLEYEGMIQIDVVYQGHFDYYTALDTTYQTDFEASFPDICFMHNERTVEYAYKGYLYPIDTLFGKTGVDIDTTQIYDNIGRVTMYKNRRFALPVDAHGFLTQFRQDIIKKNGLGFDDNTRFIPNNRAEYQTLLENLRSKADAGELLVRNINRGEDHSWKVADKNSFYPEFTQSTDPDGLSALYANNGSLANEAQDTITFGENEGFKTYLTDQVDRYNNKLMGESGTNTEMFGRGNTVMFSEGPWWVAQTYSSQWNNSELKRAGQLGVSQEDANDPVYSAPYTASRPTSWWTLDENQGTEHGTKWYGNGHAVSLTRHVTSLQKAAAALTFMKWYTQGSPIDADEADENYNLTTWCSSGHIPAWKNVYESKSYKTALEKNMTLRALGNPADVLAMEGLEYESTIFKGIGDAVSAVQSALKESTGCTKERALERLQEVVDSTQAALDLLKMDF